MNKIFLLTILFLFSNSLYAISSDNRNLINMFHKYGIKKCDSVIIETMSLDRLSNWKWDIEKHRDGIDGVTTEVTLSIIYGRKNDTVRDIYSLIQTPRHCYLHKRAILTFSGSCKSNMDGNLWYLSDQIPNLDYQVYTNKNNLDVFVKEIQMGNFKACVQEYSLRNKYSQDR